MGSEWEPPKWRQEGRTGPGPGAPKYAKAKDRNAIKKGKSVGKQKPPPKPTNGPYGWGSGPQPKGCRCPRAIRTALGGEVKLAFRYFRIGLKSRWGIS